MNRIDTSLGYPLHRHDDFWEIDLSELRIFTGLSVLANIIGEQFIDELERSPGDIAFIYKINSNINPELVQMNIRYLQMYSRSGVLPYRPDYKETFISQLISVFGTIQRPKWRRKIYPDDSIENKNNAYLKESRALIFLFHHEVDDKKKDYRFILENVVNQYSENNSFLRLTIENNNEMTAIETFSNIIVDDLATRVYIAGSTKISGSIRDNILNACNRGLDYYSEENRIYSHLFNQLIKTNLGRLEAITFRWNKAFSKFIQNEHFANSLILFKKLFLSLEAKSLCNILQHGGTIKVTLDSCYFTLYLSQIGRSLNIGINLPRQIFHLHHYLKRMPKLQSLIEKKNYPIHFSNIKVFLIHHITSEILGFIEALRQLGVYSTDVMFVKYSGIIPSAYLDALLESPITFLFMAGLEKNTIGSTTDYYSLSEYFSDTSDFSKLNPILKQEFKESSAHYSATA